MKSKIKILTRVFDNMRQLHLYNLTLNNIVSYKMYFHFKTVQQATWQKSPSTNEASSRYSFPNSVM